MAFTGYSGIFEPSDLEVIQRVFDQLCKERRLALKDKDQRELLAAEIISVFQKGATAEADLWRSLSKRRQGQNERRVA